jgi:alpha-L-rhamnosidase
MPFPSPVRSILGASLLTLLASGFQAGPAVAQSVNPKLLTSRWSASWIRHAGTPARDVGVFLFRKGFELSAAPARFVVHASGDQRYELFVNGQRVATGPARGDLDHWRFETVDIASKLKAGRNVLAAVVWNFGSEAPMAQISFGTGFLLQGDGEAEAAVNTDRTWKTAVNPAISLLPIDRKAIKYQYFVGGPGEIVDAAKYPWGWEQPDFDDGAWAAAGTATPAGPRGVRDTPSRWFLVPRGIPLMEDTPERIEKIVRSEGGDVPAEVLLGTAPWRVPAHAKVTVLLDRSHLTTAYPEVVTSGGRGASISLIYTEALHDPHAAARTSDKGNRNDVAGKVVTGLADRFLPDGGDHRLFSSLWWRTFRYVEMTVETTDEPLTIEDIRARFSAYPFQLRARFESSDATLRQMFDVGWRTARLCAHETYMDTPYWEQLQYIGDTRIQALVSLYASGDDRLVKNAIELYDESRIPDGLTQSRYPGDLPQLIPPFSLFWIGMMHDLWWYGGDRAFLSHYLHGARGVLDWFEARLAPSGLLGRLEWWNYADWVDSFPNGEPPMLETGESAILSLQFAIALREAADLESAFGSPAEAARYRALAARIVGSVVAACWDGRKTLLADTPAKTSWSQHVNLLGVLADAVPEAGRRAVMEKVLTDPSLTQTTYYFKFYLFRAMEKAGLADRYLDQLKPWQAMLDMGLTTWAETPEPTRSDSHAWSAHPTVHLLTLVAGIEPATPGFGRVRIRPHLGTLSNLSASVPTPRGDVAVSYKRAGAVIETEVILPRGVTGTIALGGAPIALHEGKNAVQLR